MPPCHIRNVKLVAKAELTILPFLAPRLFQPWPFIQKPSRTFSSLSCSESRPRITSFHGRHVERRLTKSEKCSSTTASRPGIQTSSYASTAQSRSLLHHNRSKSHRERSREVTPIATSKSKVAQEWYGAVFDPSPKDGKKGKQETSDEREGHESSLNQRRSHATKGHALQRWKQQKRTEADFAESIARSRWAAFRANSRAQASPTQSTLARSKWVQVGRPVKVLKKHTATSQTESPDQDSTDEIELRYSIPEQAYQWNLRFTRLEARHYRSANSPLRLHFRAADFARYILDAQNDGSGGIDIPRLEAHFSCEWETVWLHAAIFLLDKSPARVPHFLSLTYHHEPQIPSAWINDCFDFLVKRFSMPDARIPQQALHELVDALCAFMCRPSSRPIYVHTNFLAPLLPHCTKDQVLRISNIIRDHSVQIHWNTMLHLASALARHDCFEQALDTVLQASSSGANLQSPQFESACSTILRQSSTQSGGLRVSLRIIQNLVDLGVKINVQHCNIVMLNAIESGDFKSALDVYHSLVDSGLEADNYTHAILLKGCKSLILDSETLNDTIRQAIQGTDIKKSLFVATEILHCLYLHHFHRNPDTAFSIITEAFTQLFDATDLIRIRVLAPGSQKIPHTDLPSPTLPVLGIMISAYLRDRTSRRSQSVARNDQHLYSLYKDIRTLTQRGVEPWASMAKHDYLANAFLVAFTSNEGSLGHAAEVIRDMQTPMSASPDHSISTDTTAPAVEVCKPTVQSWSIFLNGFTRHKKMDLAEQVLKYMREKGIQPNQVTWNSVVSGYVGVRDHDQAMQAFRQMQAEGFKGTDVTFVSLGKINVDAGMLIQGEEVREALKVKLAKEQEADVDAAWLESHLVETEGEKSAAVAAASTETSGKEVSESDAGDEDDDDAAESSFWDDSQDGDDDGVFDDNDDRAIEPDASARR